MKAISKTFLTGLLVLLPVVLTFYLLYWLAVTSEAALGAMIKLALPDRWYVPGLGLFTALILAFLVGLMMHAWLFRRVLLRAESLLLQIPLVRSIYGAVRDMITFFRQPGTQAPQRVVAIRIGDTGMRVLGFVTREDFSALPGLAAGDDVAVYLPMSYQIGGYTVLVPRRWLEPVDMSLDQAVRFVMTGGVVYSPQSSTATVATLFEE